MMNFLKKIIRKRPKIIVILGQTATGKTNLSIDIAKRFNGEVVSADSRQIYRGLDLGTGKVTAEEMDEIHHHMIDIANPKEIFSVQQYVKQGTKIIDEILERKKNVIICGGTGAYIDALVMKEAFPAVAPNYDLRNKLERKTKDELFDMLKEKDPKRARSIDQHNKVRLIRALEIVEAMGRVPSRANKKSPYNVLYIGLRLGKEILHENIYNRILKRLDHGMLDEAKNLHKEGLSYNRMEQLGLEYRFMGQHLKGEISYIEMIEGLTTATRQFAKRQNTWFKRNKKIQWFHPQNNKDLIMKNVSRFLKR